MTQFVTIEEVRDHLRIDSYGDDLWLDLFITVVSEAVISWLKDEWRCYVPMIDSNGDAIVDSNGDEIPATDGNGDYTVKPVVKGAVLVELAQQYRFRDGSGAATVDANAGYGYVLGKGATALLSGLRKTTIK